MKSIFAVLLTLSFFSCREDQRDPAPRQSDAYFKDIKDNDVRLDPPKEGEWLYEQKERGQSFEQYKQARPLRPSDEKSVIYLKPIGRFNPLQLKVIGLMCAYAKIYFQQNVQLMDVTSDAVVPDSCKRTSDGKNVQLLTTYIMDNMLKNKIPADGLVMMAISEKDLYPAPDWNYVFGIASYHDYIGVSSIYRLQDQWLDSTNFKRCLRRLIQVSTHEIGHMLSMHHCISARCNMNGSNSLNESDGQPVRLCSECQQKLHWNLGYDNQVRLQQQITFLIKHGLKEDADMLQRDLDAVD